MIPYYDEVGITIYHGDCRDVLPTIRGVDLVFTSPPYNLCGTTGSSWSKLGNGYGAHLDAMPHAEYVAWQQDVLRLCWGTLTDSGAIYYQHKPRVLNKGVLLPFDLNPGLPLRQVVTWDRGTGFMQSPNCYVPRYEWILIFAKDEFRVTGAGVFDLWKIPPPSGSQHPAPFPIELASMAVNTTPATIICDPFAGSGTTLRAAKDAGRRAIGIEIEERYCEIAAKRLAQGVLDFGSAS